MSGHILYVGGEDHHLRLPFLLAIQRCGFRVTAAGSGPAEPFQKAGIDFREFEFARTMNPLSDLRSIRALAGLLGDLRPDLAQAYDAKPCLMLPLAARLARRGANTIRTMCGRGWVYSPGSLAALAVRPAFHILHRVASRSTAATVFEIDDDRAFFDRHGITGRNGVVIPAGGGGIDDEGFERALAVSASREDVRRDLGLPKAEIVITVGRVTRQKGIPTLLKAAAIVHADRPAVRFLLVGPRESEGPWAVSQAELEFACTLRHQHRPAFGHPRAVASGGSLCLSNRISRGNSTRAFGGCNGPPSNRCNEHAWLLCIHSRSVERTSGAPARARGPGKGNY